MLVAREGLAEDGTKDSDTQKEDFYDIAKLNDDLAMSSGAYNK